MKPVNLESMFPELYQHALSLHGDMVVVAFAIVLIGMTLRFWWGMFGDVGEMLRGILTAAIIAIIIPLLPDWINQLQLLSHEYVQTIGASPDTTNERFAQILISESADDPGSLGFWEIIWSDQTSIGEAFAYAIVHLASQCAWAIMWLFFIVQQALLIYAISLTPVFIAFFMLSSMRGVAGQFILGTLSVALWPLGWAIAGMLTDALMDMSVGAENTLWGNTQSFFFIIVLTIWIVYSTIKAPQLIYQLLTRGASAGAILFNGFVTSISQGGTYAAGAGVASHMLGSSAIGTTTSAIAGGAAGVLSGAVGHSSVLIPSAIGLGVSLATAKGSGASGADATRPNESSNYNTRAHELYQQSNGKAQNLTTGFNKKA